MTTSSPAIKGENPKPWFFPELVDEHRRSVASLPVNNQGQLDRAGAFQLRGQTNRNLVKTGQYALHSRKLHRQVVNAAIAQPRFHPYRLSKVDPHPRSEVDVVARVEVQG